LLSFEMKRWCGRNAIDKMVFMRRRMTCFPAGFWFRRAVTVTPTDDGTGKMN
jgi:hypothetical protein